MRTLTQNLQKRRGEVLDQTISLLRSMKECGCNLDTRDKENLDSVAWALVGVLSVLRRRTITPSTVAADSITIDREKGKQPGRPSLETPVEMLEELRGLGFTWTRIFRDDRSSHFSRGKDKKMFRCENHT